jgi:hypothetical protein
VTPIGRVAGRSVTTVEGLPAAERAAWAAAFVATGGSQCGFCTPGIVARLSALRAKGVSGDRVRDVAAPISVGARLVTIVETYDTYGRASERDLERAARRAAIEGRTVQRVGGDVVLGGGGFADDLAPADALVALRAADGSWVVGETLTEARALTAKVQGRRTTASLRWPIELPPGDWARTLQTTWVEPAYLEARRVAVRPGGTPATPLANGGAFGGKTTSAVAVLASEPADEQRAASRTPAKTSVRLGAKRPPLAAGVGSMAPASSEWRTPGIAAAIAPSRRVFVVEELDAGAADGGFGAGPAGSRRLCSLASLARRDEIHAAPTVRSPTRRSPTTACR